MRPPGTAPDRVSYVLAGPHYFDTLGLRIIRGRRFGDLDGTPGHETAVVNQRFALMFFPSDGPVGHRIRLAKPPSSRTCSARTCIRSRRPRRTNGSWRRTRSSQQTRLRRRSARVRPTCMRRVRALHVMNNRNISTRRSRLLNLSATRQGTRPPLPGCRVHRRNLWNRPAALEADD